MEINIIYFKNAEAASGLTVVIDVFRAFSTAYYVIANGAERIIPVGNIEKAYALNKRHPEYVLMGERKGEIQPGFDYGNSPYLIKDIDFSGKTVVMTTSHGTQGIVKAKKADEIIVGSFVNANRVSHPEGDFDMCMALDRFDFALKLSNENNIDYLSKI